MNSEFIDAHALRATKLCGFCEVIHLKEVCKSILESGRDKVRY